MSNQLFEAIESIGKGFDEFKRVNDERLDEERKGNEARARELADALDKISADLTENQKKKEVLEKRLSTQADRLELLEATMDKPRMSM
jgi:septal ring factor EnvC (AmiA/AmiB activator)